MLPLYEKIEELCRKDGINITEMCRRTGVSRSTLSDYKTGRKKSISLNNILKISEYFGITVDELLKRVPNAREEQFTEAQMTELLRKSVGCVRLLTLVRDSSDEEIEKIVHIVEALRKTGT